MPVTARVRKDQSQQSETPVWVSECDLANGPSSVAAQDARTLQASGVGSESKPRASVG